MNTLTENKYSYYWQTKTGKLIYRWDNTLHYPEIETFSHHKHKKTSKSILPFQETALEKVLELISKSIVKPQC